MFDSVSKFQIEQYPEDFATWLIGRPITFTTLKPSELSIEPIRADSMILLNSSDMILHVEFQTQPDPKIGFRTADYRLRGYRKFPGKDMRQIIIYLRPTTSTEVYKTTFQAGKLHHEFEVIRIWEVPAAELLKAPGLWPYAVLSDTQQPEVILSEVVSRIEALPRSEQSNLLAVTSVMAGLTLDKEVIQRLIRSDVMQESVIYQDILAEGLATGRAQGVAQGMVATMSRQLSRKLGVLPIDLQTQISALGIDRLEALSDALFDLNSLDELTTWLTQ